MSQHVIKEVMSMLGIKFQVAKSIVKLAGKPEGTFQQIGSSWHSRRAMSQAEAKRAVDAAKERIRLVDEGG